MPISVEDATEPSFLEGLETLDISDLRSRRDDCQTLENAVSYVRRLVHGRLDIVRGEIESRDSGGGSADLRAVVDRLPALLAEGSRAPGLPRPPQDLAPGAVADGLVEDLEAAFPSSVMGAVPRLGEEELADLATRLGGYERDISERRRRLHAVIDALQEEVIRRYRAGEASVDSLLEG